MILSAATHKCTLSFRPAFSAAALPLVQFPYRSLRHSQRWLPLLAARVDGETRVEQVPSDVASVRQRQRHLQAACVPRLRLRKDGGNGADIEGLDSLTSQYSIFNF